MHDIWWQKKEMFVWMANTLLIDARNRIRFDIQINDLSLLSHDHWATTTVEPSYKRKLINNETTRENNPKQNEADGCNIS